MMQALARPVITDTGGGFNHPVLAWMGETIEHFRIQAVVAQLAI